MTTTETISGARHDKINLGCGRDKRAGWLDVDIDQTVFPDLILDLEAVPWPFSDDAFSDVLIDNVFEHISPEVRLDVIDELHRVTKPDGEVIMRLPVPEIGVGWDLTHPAVPHWRWPHHPRHRDQWEVTNIAASKVGPGKLMPAPLAILATRFWLARCVDEVELRLRPTKERVDGE